MGMIGNLLRVSTQDLKAFQKDSSQLEDKVYSGDDVPELIDVDKSWEAIFYLITGHCVADIEEAKPPLSWILFSGQIVDEEQDLGYGPAHYIDANQVKQLNKVLETITEEDLRKKYDGAQMNDIGIYPEGWDEPESIKYVMDNFSMVKEFYKAAENENQAVITFVS